MKSLVAVFVLAACGGGGGGYKVSDIKGSSPAGTIDGATWGLSKATIRSDGTTLSVNLFADPNVADCAQFQDASSPIPFIIFSMPAQIGTRPLQLSLSDFSDPSNQTVTFVTPPSSNNIATDGIIDVSALATSVTLGLLADAGHDTVNGTLATALCP